MSAHKRLNFKLLFNADEMKLNKKVIKISGLDY